MNAALVVVVGPEYLRPPVPGVNGQTTWRVAFTLRSLRAWCGLSARPVADAQARQAICLIHPRPTLISPAYSRSAGKHIS